MNPQDIQPVDFYEAQDTPLNGAAKHIMVCCGPRCNDTEDNIKTYERFCRKIQAAGLAEGPQSVKITPVECTGICAEGTCAYVVPDAVYYHKLEGFAVDAVVNQHLKLGKPVENLILKDR